MRIAITAECKCVCVWGGSEFLTPQATMRFAEKIAMTAGRFQRIAHTHTLNQISFLSYEWERKFDSAGQWVF